MDRDELMDRLEDLISQRKKAALDLHNASQDMLDIERSINDLIDQLQPRIEVTKPREFDEHGMFKETIPPDWKRPEPETPSERVHDALLHAGRRLTTEEIAHITGLGRRQVGPCLGVLVKGGRIRNVGNGTWTAA